MSEEPSSRTPEEIAADVARTLAETKKIEAETKKKKRYKHEKEYRQKLLKEIAKHIDISKKGSLRKTNNSRRLPELFTNLFRFWTPAKSKNIYIRLKKTNFKLGSI